MAVLPPNIMADTWKFLIIKPFSLIRNINFDNFYDSREAEKVVSSVYDDSTIIINDDDNDTKITKLIKFTKSTRI